MCSHAYTYRVCLYNVSTHTHDAYYTPQTYSEEDGKEKEGEEVSPTQNTKSFQVFVNVKLLTKSFNEFMDSSFQFRA